MNHPHDIFDFPNTPIEAWVQHEGLYDQYGMTIPEAIAKHMDLGINQWLIVRNQTVQCISSHDAYQEMRTKGFL